MANINVYVKANANAEVTKPEVFLKDIAKIYTADSQTAAKIKAIKVFTFPAGGQKERKQKRQVISILKVVEMMEAACPGITVNSLGETAVLIEWIKVRKQPQPLRWIKIAIAGGISFFGTAFTIMAFHNDISVNKVFAKIYELVMGQPSNGYTVLEISYSIGLGLGIILFFNHVGGRRITKDPTPIEVAMKNYEDDVNQSLVNTSDRKGETIDVP